jgi:hypothetical protein
MRQSSYSSRPLTHEFTFAEFVHTFITCNFKVRSSGLKTCGAAAAGPWCGRQLAKDDILREFFKEMLAQTWFNKRRNVLLATL